MPYITLKNNLIQFPTTWEFRDITYHYMNILLNKGIECPDNFKELDLAVTFQVNCKPYVWINYQLMCIDDILARSRMAEISIPHGDVTPSIVNNQLVYNFYFSIPIEFEQIDFHHPYNYSFMTEKTITISDIYDSNYYIKITSTNDNFSMGYHLTNFIRPKLAKGQRINVKLIVNTTKIVGITFPAKAVG